MLRLSQALARLRFADSVIPEDVDEALRLVEVSRASLYDEDRARRGDMSVSSRIFNLVRGMRDSGAAATEGGRNGELDLRRVRERVLAKGFTVQQLEACLDEYADLDVSVFPSVVPPFTDSAGRSGRRRPKARGWYSLRLGRTTMRIWTFRAVHGQGGNVIYTSRWSFTVWVLRWWHHMICLYAVMNRIYVFCHTSLCVKVTYQCFYSETL